MLNLLTLAAPLFVACVATEWALARRWHKPTLEIGDAVSNTFAGISERLFDFYWAILLYGAFVWLHDKAALFDIPHTPWAWALCFLAYDFLYYWYHRLGHEVNALWAIHIVHHHSTHYNLTVASRQTGLQMMLKSLFFAPIAITGFPPDMAFGVFAIAGAYGFFLHTELIGRLGPLEHILATPSAHRVHHGRNPEYLDKNYGGVFIFWDKWLGTCAAEVARVDYGITKPFQSRNVYWATVHHWVELFARARKIESWADKLRLFVRGPTWRAPSEPSIAVDTSIIEPVKPVSASLAVYQIVQSVCCLALLGSMLLQRGDLSAQYTPWIAHYANGMTPMQVLACTWIVVLATLTVPVLAEQKKWAVWGEYFRLGSAAVLFPIVFYGAAWTWVVAVGCALSGMSLMCTTRTVPQRGLHAQRECNVLLRG